MFEPEICAKNKKWKHVIKISFENLTTHSRKENNQFCHQTFFSDFQSSVIFLRIVST
jgi:hypothetical protein